MEMAVDSPRFLHQRSICKIKDFEAKNTEWDG